MFEDEWTIAAAREWGLWQLEPFIVDDVERQAQVDYVLTGLMEWNYAQLANNVNTVLADDVLTHFKEAIKKIKAGQPVQYALGQAAFFGREFVVDERVLIPRQETEELVAWALDSFSPLDPVQVLDLGTGSGAIAITVANERPHWVVTASDVSRSALSVAKINAQRLGAAVEFVESDLFTNIKTEFDLIISNPPYISENEKTAMDQSVLDYEPALALFADHDGLAVYEALAQQLLEHLKVGGQAYFEIGYQQGPSVVKLFKQLPHVSVKLKQDMSGHDRMVQLKREA